MSKPEWGQKLTCPACGARFYDMQKSPAVCPKCENEFDPTAVVKKRRGRPPLAEKRKAEVLAAAEAEAKAKAKAKAAAPEEDLDIEIDADIDLDDVDEDILEDDEDDISDEDVGVSVPNTKDND